MQLKNLALLFLFCCFAANINAQSSAETETFAPTIKVKGLIQSRFEASLTDSINVLNRYSENPVANNFRIRRAEIRTDIKLNEHFSGVARIQLPELEGNNVGRTVELAYMEFKLNKLFSVRAGQFKMPFELDELTSHEDLRMIDRGTTRDILVANNLASYQSGVMVFGTFMSDKTPLNYYLAVGNGSNRNVVIDDNTQKNVVLRLDYSLIKSLTIGANIQNISTQNQNTNSYGADLSFQKKITPKMKLILEGEYIQGINIASFTSAIADDTVGAEYFINDFTLNGYFAQALLKLDVNKHWCNVFEIGGKFENTDPNTLIESNAYSTVTGDIAFTFTPNNTARLQLNLIHSNWESAISPGGIDQSNIFIAQFQLKI